MSEIADIARPFEPGGRLHHFGCGANVEHGIVVELGCFVNDAATAEENFNVLDPRDARGEELEKSRISGQLVFLMQPLANPIEQRGHSGAGGRARKLREAVEYLEQG